MPVRLSKASKVLNIGMTIAIEYLASLGHILSVDPNLILNDELYLLLSERFKKDEKYHLKSKEINLIPHTKKRQNQNELIDKTPQNINSLDSLTHLTQFNLIGAIDLNLTNTKALRSEEKNTERLSNNALDTNRIDSNLSNQSKKSKMVFQEQTNNNKDYLKEIWEKYTDVQEQLIRIRSVPVSIIPNSVKILGEKLFINVNENVTTDRIIEEIALLFELPPNELKIKNGFFYADNQKSQSIKQEAKNQLSEKATKNFINFYPIPVIDGIIKTLKKEIRLSIAPNPAFFFKRKYPEYCFEHKTLFVKKKVDGLQYAVRIKTEKEIDDKLFAILSKSISLKKDLKFPKTYTYDFCEFIERLSKNEKNIYLYDKDEFLQQFLERCIKNKVDIRVDSNEVIITIDSNVKEEDIIYDLLVENNKVYFYNYSCVSVISHLIKAETYLREKFPSINIKIDDKNGTLHFYQGYQNSEQRSKIKQILETELSELRISTPNMFSYMLFDNSTNKEKYILEINELSKKESQASALRELRGADFCVDKIYFGKLFRINYPELIFDISGNEFENTKNLFESHIVSSIEPNLTGDLEKVYRLKNSLSNILKGTNLQNPNLKDFIFDAEKAKKIENIDYHTNSLSDTFKELEYHLLNKNINESQKQAIIKTLLAEELALIQGPPGTGKSTAIAEIIWQHIRKNPKERILLTSETNLAVDNAIDRIVNSSHNLVKPIRFGDEEKLEMEGRQFSIEVMKRWVQDGTVEINSEDVMDDEESTTQKLILNNWIENIKNRARITNDLDNETLNLWVETLSNPSKEIRQIFFNNYIKNCNLIGATCSSIGEKNTKNKPTSFFKSYCEVFGKVSTQFNRNNEEYTTYNGDLKFSTIIQDESSKATPAELSLPLIYGKKNIIIGDHRQLPPMLDKEEFKLSLDFLLERTENKDEKKKIQKLKSFVINNFNEMEISHFERLFDKIDPSLKGIFNKQYRMHPDINEVIKQFYINDGGLECGLINPTDLGVNDSNMHNSASRYHGIEIDELISKNNHVIWIDTNSPELLDGTSRINYGEVDAIKDVLTKFRNSDSFQQYQSFWKNPDDQQIGIISFYGKQIKLLRNLRNEFKDIPIRVSTVDRFQGMERNIIIVSMVRSNRIASDKNQKADFNLYGELGFTEQNDLGFAQSPNRLNVALSRAKRLLIIVGNSDLFKQKEIYKNVYQTIVENPNGRIIKYETL